MTVWFVVILCVTFGKVMSHGHYFFSHKMEISTHLMDYFKWKGNPAISCPLVLGILCFCGLSLWSPSTHSDADLSTSSRPSKGPTHTSVFMSKVNYAEAFARLKRKFILHTWFFFNFNYLFFALLKSFSWAVVSMMRETTLFFSTLRAQRDQSAWPLSFPLGEFEFLPLS